MATELIRSTAVSFPSLEHYQLIRKKLRDSGYAAFTRDDVWYYHAYDYGWRRVFLNQRNEVSPIDEDGQWFNGLMVDRTEQVFQNRKDAGRKAIAAARDADMIREGRDILNRWAQAQGHADIDAYADAKGIHWSDAYAEYARSLATSAPPPVWGFQSPAAALGVTAREWSPDEMAEGRKQIGMET